MVCKMAKTEVEAKTVLQLVALLVFMLGLYSPTTIAEHFDPVYLLHAAFWLFILSLALPLIKSL